MVVALPGDVLFTSGSAWLSKRAKTIDEVAKQLTKIPERKFQIEGHTDIVPINTEKVPLKLGPRLSQSSQCFKTNG